MGVTVNVVKDSSLYKNFNSNMTSATKTCPIVSELKDITSGFACKKFQKASINGVLLAAFILPIGIQGTSPLKIASNPTKIGTILTNGAIPGIIKHGVEPAEGAD